MSTTPTSDEGLKDIELCYTAMGLSMGDSPAKIEMTYKRLVEMYKANLAAPDHRAREEAKGSLRLIEEMYDKIKNSVTYQSMLREQERRGKLQGGAERARTANAGAGMMDRSLMHCPMCHTVITKGIKICPRCKGRIYTPAEKLMNKIFTKTNMIIFFGVALLAVTAFFGLMFPEQIKMFPEQIKEIVNSFRR
jgi:hypothetical protein